MFDGIGDVEDSAERLSKVAINTLFNICAAWSLNDKEVWKLLGSPEPAIFAAWKGEPGKATLQADDLERISHILGIYKALQILLPDQAAADGWVKKPNTSPLFNGSSALEKMISGDIADLSMVRQYLDGQLNY
jgi:hypothetical protein